MYAERDSGCGSVHAKKERERDACMAFDATRKMLPDLVARAAHDLLSRNPAPDRKHCPREKGRNS